MDEQRFEELSKKLATSVSRRRAVKILGTTAFGGLAALVGARGAFADHECRDIGSNCRSNAECCTRVCVDFHCMCPEGTEVCEGQCFPLCEGNKVRSPTTCQCVCPTGTEECLDGTCAPLGECPPICSPFGQFCNVDNECCPEAPLCCDVPQLGGTFCLTCCQPCMTDPECAGCTAMTGIPHYCEPFAGVCLPQP